jgi:hypothetical protein
MPKTSKETASDTIAMEGFEGQYEKLEGGYTVGFETYSSDADLADFFRGLPDDRCQCPHWGYVISGNLTLTYSDHEETHSAGDAYYAPPGHTPRLFAGTEIVEFSPTDALKQTVAVVTENLRTAGIEV